jgi:hypothetical protein
MKRKIDPGDFAVALFITERGVLDFKVLSPDKRGFERSRRVCKLLMRHVNEIDMELELLREDESDHVNDPKERGL